MYSDLYFQEKKPISIPKIFWVGIIALGALVSSQVFFWYASVPTRASEVIMKRSDIVNITPNSFGLLVETDEPTSVYAVFGVDASKLDKTIYGSSDSAKSQTPKKYHYFSFVDLKDSSKYYYKLITDNQLIEKNGVSLFSQETTSKETFGAPSSKNPIYGKVIAPNGKGMSSVYLIISRFDNPSAQQMKYMATSKESGEWLYSLPSNFAQTDTIAIEVLHESYPESKIQTVVSKASPLPQTTIVGNDYVFGESENVLGVKTDKSGSPAETYIISILYPEANSIIPDPKPLFKGYGIPRTNVSIETNSKPAYRAKTIVNAQGSWTIEPNTPFAPGPYTVNVKIQDTSGQVRNLSRSFVVAKSGEQVLGESSVSTPSGTLVPSQPAQISISPTTIVIPSIAEPSVTQAPVVNIITATPALLSPTPKILQQAGIEFPTWLPIIGGLMVILGYAFIRSTASHFS